MEIWGKSLADEDILEIWDDDEPQKAYPSPDDPLKPVLTFSVVESMDFQSEMLNLIADLFGPKHESNNWALQIEELKKSATEEKSAAAAGTAWSKSTNKAGTKEAAGPNKPRSADEIDRECNEKIAAVLSFAQLKRCLIILFFL